MRSVKVILGFFFCILYGLACQTPSKTGSGVSCVLTIHSDNTYEYKYPNFLNSKTENGTYKLYNDSIVLLRKHYSKIDSIDLGYTCWKDNPDTLLLTFKNLYKEKIQATVKLNNSLKNYKTDSKGHIEIHYGELENQNIISKGDKISEFKISFDNKEYLMNMEYYKDSRKPDRLDFTLNQFIGQDYAILKRKYPIKGDTIFINDISRKVIGLDNRLILKKKKAGNTIYSK
jgi:hypothetical protein